MNFEVKAVHGAPREWNSKQGGTFLSYKVDLEDQDGIVERAVEWNKKDSSRPPEVGELVAGHLEDARFGTKLKVDYEASKALPQNGVQMRSRKPSPHEVTAKGSWTPESERDPERAARILRQHSQEMALRWVALSEPGDHNLDWSVLVALADRFDQDVLQAGKRASEGQKTGGTPPPETTESSSPSSPSSEELRDIEMALDCIWVGANADARKSVAIYMLSQLNEKDLLRACNQLSNAQDPHTQQVTLDAMKQRTVKWSGKALPKDNDPLDGIPF